MPATESDSVARKLFNAWAEFASPEKEAAFRQFRRADENSLGLLVAGVAVVMSLIFIPTDRELLGSSPAFWQLVAMRVGYAAFSVVMVFVLRRDLPAPVIDRVLLVFYLTGVSLQFAVGSSRPSIFFLGYAHTDLLIILAWYVVVPLSFRFQAALGLLSTIGDLYLLSRRPELQHLLRRSLVVSYVMINVLAGVTSWILHGIRRREFAALRRAEELRANLESALAEVKTLRGILPICAHCKRVRNDTGFWQQVEEYVHDHTEAQFSHGICPECMHEHFAAYLKDEKAEEPR
jgi:hypothetical protein